MNFYKHHIGDYAQATAHLTFVEDAAYSRLLRKYYAEEGPIPGDLKAVQRLVGARTRDEKEAVEAVLAEFFELEADGWHNKRADEELARWRAQAEVNRRTAEEREAKKRARAEHEAGTNRGAPQHESSVDEKHESFASREPSQKPEARSQKKATAGAPHTTGNGDDPAPPGSERAFPTRAGEAAAAMRKAGIRVTSQNPDLITAVDVERVPIAALIEFAELYPHKPAGYVIAAARRQHAEQAADIEPGATHASSSQRPRSVVERVRANVHAAEQRDRDAAALGDADAMASDG